MDEFFLAFVPDVVLRVLVPLVVRICLVLRVCSTMTLSHPLRSPQWPHPQLDNLFLASCVRFQLSPTT